MLLNIALAFITRNTLLPYWGLNFEHLNRWPILQMLYGHILLCLAFNFPVRKMDATFVIYNRCEFIKLSNVLAISAFLQLTQLLSLKKLFSWGRHDCIVVVITLPWSSQFLNFLFMIHFCLEHEDQVAIFLRMHHHHLRWD